MRNIEEIFMLIHEIYDMYQNTLEIFTPCAFLNKISLCKTVVNMHQKYNFFWS